MKWLVLAFCAIGTVASAECIALGDLDYVLPVDGDVTISTVGNSITIDIATGGRAPKEITFFIVDGQIRPEKRSPYSRVLDNGLTVNYATTTGEAEGSGGAEVILSGWIEPDRIFSVSCRTQTEYGSPEWCLPVLGQLRTKAEGCGTEGE